MFVMIKRLPALVFSRLLILTIVVFLGGTTSYVQGNTQVKIIEFDPKSGDRFQPSDEIIIFNFDVNPDKSLIAVVGRDGLNLYDATNFNFLSNALEDLHLWTVSWSPDGRYLAVAGTEEPLRLCQMSERTIVSCNKLEGSQNENPWVGNVLWSPDSTMMAARNWVWKVESGGLVYEFEDDIFISSWSPNGKLLLFFDRKAREFFSLWNTVNQEVITTYQGNNAEALFEPVWSPSGEFIAAQTIENTVNIWKIDNDSLPIYSIDIHKSQVTHLLWSSDNNFLVSGDLDGLLHIWNMAEGETYQVLDVHQNRIRDLQWSPSGEYLAVVGDNASMYLWNFLSGQLFQLNGHQGNVYSVDWSENGQQLATIGEDHIVNIWNANNGQLVRSLEAHNNTVWENIVWFKITWIKNGNLFISFSSDDAIRLWDTTTGQEIANIE